MIDGDIEKVALGIGDKTDTAQTDATQTASLISLIKGLLSAEQPSTVKSGEIAGSATANQLSNISCKMVRFKAVSSNAGNVYIGGAGVTKVNGTGDTTTGLELLPNEDTGWIPITNLNKFYIICDNAGDDLTYIALS